jgi:two-component system LytT family response regulator
MTTHSNIPLATARGLYFLNTEEIVRLEASSNYTSIYFTNKTKLVSAKVLKEFAAMLEPFGFVRTHRTHLINRLHINCISPNGNIIMKDASVAEISRRMRGIVMKILGHAA